MGQHNRYVVDEIRVLVIVRELDDNGETIDKHAAEQKVFVNEKSFRKWAKIPLTIRQESTGVS